MCMSAYSYREFLKPSKVTSHKLFQSKAKHQSNFIVLFFLIMYSSLPGFAWGANYSLFTEWRELKENSLQGAGCRSGQTGLLKDISVLYICWRFAQLFWFAHPEWLQLGPIVFGQWHIFLKVILPPECIWNKAIKLQYYIYGSVISVIVDHLPLF